MANHWEVVDVHFSLKEFDLVSCRLRDRVYVNVRLGDSKVVCP